MPLLNAVVTFPTVFLQVLMACVHKNVKLCTFPKVWCKSNFTHFGTEFAVKYTCVHSVCSIYTHIVRTTICIAPYTYVVKDNIHSVTAVKAQRGSRGIALLFLSPLHQRGIGVQCHTPGCFTPGKDPVPIM